MNLAHLLVLWSMERCPERKDVRNGYRKRDFETIYGVVENMAIPQSPEQPFHKLDRSQIPAQTRKNSSSYLQDLPSRSQYERYQEDLKASLRENLSSRVGIQVQQGTGAGSSSLAR